MNLAVHLKFRLRASRKARCQFIRFPFRSKTSSKTTAKNRGRESIGFASRFCVLTSCHKPRTNLPCLSVAPPKVATAEILWAKARFCPYYSTSAETTCPQCPQRAPCSLPYLRKGMKSVLVAWGYNSVPLDILFRVPTYIGLAQIDLPLKSSLTLYLLLLFLMLLPCLHMLLA